MDPYEEGVHNGKVEATLESIAQALTDMKVSIAAAFGESRCANGRIDTLYNILAIAALTIIGAFVTMYLELRG